MDRMEANSDMTRLRNEDQYLEKERGKQPRQTDWFSDIQSRTYLVTLKMRNKRRARITEKPKEPPLNSDQITSNMLPTMTMQSKRLKADEKYTLIPRAYILKHISHTKRPRKTNSAMSAMARKNISQQGLRDPNLVVVGGGLTKEISEKGWLALVFHGDAGSVEEDK